jgi:hypothetical protein
MMPEPIDDICCNLRRPGRLSVGQKLQAFLEAELRAKCHRRER